jgi:hypothetical protein
MKIFFENKQLKHGLTIDEYTPSYGLSIGETQYVVCDSVGVIFQTIFPQKLEQFFVDKS